MIDLLSDLVKLALVAFLIWLGLVAISGSLIFSALLSGSETKWVTLVDTDEFTGYTDPATIRKSSNMVMMWSLYDFKTTQVGASGERFLSLKTQHEFDCKDERNRMLYFTQHSGQMGDGKVVYTYNGEPPDKWTPVAPGSIAETLWKLACGKL